MPLLNSDGTFSGDAAVACKTPQLHTNQPLLQRRLRATSACPRTDRLPGFARSCAGGSGREALEQSGEEVCDGLTGPGQSSLEGPSCAGEGSRCPSRPPSGLRGVGQQSCFTPCRATSSSRLSRSVLLQQTGKGACKVGGRGCCSKSFSNPPNISLVGLDPQLGDTALV